MEFLDEDTKRRCKVYMNNQSAVELIKKRISVRTYSDMPIEPDKLDAVKKFLEQNTDNPFGASLRFSLLKSGTTPKRLGTYGFIKGAKVFFAGCVKKGERDLEGFGYAFEKAVLYAISLGFGTCWLGGTLRRGAFEKAMQPENEYLPAASPLGYANEKRSFIEKTVAKSAGARNRKSFDDLFFDNDFGNSLVIPESDIKTCLEMVRIAPSASNKQPWRVLRLDDKYHFYLTVDKKYMGNTAFGFCMQRIDMGIAACHFSMAASELGVPGCISFDKPKIFENVSIEDKIRYSFTWS